MHSGGIGEQPTHVRRCLVRAVGHLGEGEARSIAGGGRCDLVDVIGTQQLETHALPGECFDVERWRAGLLCGVVEHHGTSLADRNPPIMLRYLAPMADSTTGTRVPASIDDLFDHSTILPSDPTDDSGDALEVLHDREYRVRAFRKRDDLLLIRGAVRDQKPPGLYLETDPDPLTIHHMQIEIEVAFPSMEIVAAHVAIETHPHEQCPRIADHYDNLVGLSIARGFTHKVRDLFGGPRGCTHTTALLQAMGPVAIQCMWSMRASVARRDDGATDRRAATPEQRRMMWQTNLNTCHIWAEDGEQVAHLEAGGEMEPPVWAVERMVQLGLKPDEWRSRMQG